MKNILILFILFSGYAYGQFTVSNSNWTEKGRYLQAIKLYQNDDKTKAKIWYVDFNTILQKTNILSPTMDYEFEFSTEPDTLDKLYDLIKVTLEKKTTEVISVTFPEGIMHLNFMKSLGSYYVNFQFENKSSIIDNNSTSRRETYALNLKRLDKFFGKEK